MSSRSSRRARTKTAEMRVPAKRRADQTKRREKVQPPVAPSLVAPSPATSLPVVPQFEEIKEIEQPLRHAGRVGRVRAMLETEMPPRQVVFGVSGLIAAAAGTLAVIGWRKPPSASHTPLQLGLVIVAGASVALADILIKRVASESLNFSTALFHPMILLALALYVAQIALFAYVFVQRWDLSLVGLSQMIVYAATVVLVGVVIFQERITVAHGAGMALALVGALLMNL